MSVRSTSKTWFAGLLAVLVLALAGCQAEEEPESTASVHPTHTSSSVGISATASSANGTVTSTTAQDPSQTKTEPAPTQGQSDFSGALTSTITTQNPTPAPTKTTKTPAITPTKAPTTTKAKTTKSTTKPPVKTTTKTPTKSTAKPTTTTAKPVDPTAFAAEVVRLVNVERAKEGLAPLGTLSNLTQAAEVRAKEQLTLYSHDRPDGTSCFTVLGEYGVSYRMAGENIAKGYTTPAAVVDGWMHSQGHRENILNPNFTHIGAATARKGNGTRYWVQLFIAQN